MPGLYLKINWTYYLLNICVAVPDVNFVGVTRDKIRYVCPTVLLFVVVFFLGH